MIMNRFLIFLFVFGFTTACKTSGNENETKTETAAAPAPVIPQGDYLPSITVPDMEILWNNCNQVDYIYYELPISTSLNDQYSIQQSLRHVSEAPVPMSVKNKCKPISRIFYKNEGEDLMEAEIYFSSGCTFFVFFKDGKPAYSNLMTNDGIKHFNDILAKVQSIQPRQ